MPNKKGAGRPTKKDEDNVRKLVKALENGHHRHSSCVLAGVGRSTFYQRLDSDPDFKTKIEAAEEFRLGIVEQEMRKKITVEKYYPAIKDELKAKRRKLYGDKVDHTSDGEKIGTIMVGGLSSISKESSKSS